MLDPLTVERIVRVSAAAPIVVALSGGGDSVALLRLLAAHLGAEKLHALVVDHALRDGSADDALRAQAFATALGVRADVLTIQRANGVKRGQAAARRARYAILSDRARALGAKVIAVAHSADDQIETLLMRAAAGSSWRGLAGMAAFAPAPVWPEGRGVWLARPLLAQRRAALRAYLRAQGVAWIEDPANDNPAFERVRVRARAAMREQGGANMMLLPQLAGHIRRRADALDREASALIAGAARFDGPTIAVDQAAWLAAPGHVRRRVLSVLITAAAGAHHEPGAGVNRIEQMLIDGVVPSGTLGGALVTRGPDAFCISRDPGALRGRADGLPPLAPLALKSGQPTVWDGRLELVVTEPGWFVVATPEGAQLRRDGEHMSLSSLQDGNTAVWLLRQRVAHLLNEHD